MGYDRHQFIENIESIQGIIPIRVETAFNGVSANVYQGLTGKTVLIDSTDLDEDVLEDEGIGILKKLGLDYCIPMFFPPKEIIQAHEDEEKEMEALEELKEQEEQKEEMEALEELEEQEEQKEEMEALKKLEEQKVEKKQDETGS